MVNTTCPVCGSPVDPAVAPTATYRGATYALRCPHCKARFDREPERFLAGVAPHCAHDAPACCGTPCDDPVTR